MMYQVSAHHYGRGIIRNGPMSGCMGFQEHEWRGIGSSRSKAKAIGMAQAHPTRATVVVMGTSTVVFDNLKSPAPRDPLDIKSAEEYASYNDANDSIPAAQKGNNHDVCMGH